MALCDAVARDGNCDHYECYSISEGEKLTENFYGDLDTYCEENMTPCKYWSDGIEVWLSECCSGTVTVGANGEPDTCEE